MVLKNTGLPDPDNPEEDFRISNDNIIIGTDEDSDQEVETEMLEYAHYQPLPTFCNEERDSLTDEDIENESHDSNTIENTNNYNESGTNEPIVPVPHILPMETILLKEVWSGPSPEVCDIKMDSQKVDEVKQAMLNITLPASAIPDWATNIPEEEWKIQLLKKLQSDKK